MKRELYSPLPLLLLALVMSPLLQAAQGPFIELTAEVHVDGFQESSVARCVFGRDSWMMETEGRNWKMTYWFTGTNIIQHLTEKEKFLKDDSTYPKTMSFDSVDGNPGRPVHSTDVFGFLLTPKFFWLAFCSAPTLKHNPHTIYPPYQLWKEHGLVCKGWLEKADVFNDSLGLPKTITLSATNDQPVFRYQVHETTNVLGCNVPLEFSGVQYVAFGTNAWTPELAFKGKVISISPGKEPQIPAEIVKAAQVPGQNWLGDAPRPSVSKEPK